MPGTTERHVAGISECSPPHINNPLSIRARETLFKEDNISQEYPIITAALVAAWLLGSSSMHRKFNSDHFTFLKFENPSSGSKFRWQFWQQLCD